RAPAPATCLPRLAPGDPRNGPDPRPVRRCPCGGLRCRRHGGVRDHPRRAGPRPPRLGDRRGRNPAGVSVAHARADHRVSPWRTHDEAMSTTPKKARAVGEALAAPGGVTFASVPDGVVGKLIADLAQSLSGRLLFVARDGQRLAEVERTVRFFAPGVRILDFPAWDCLPYDRASPHATVVADRMATLSRLLEGAPGPTLVLTTVNAVLQRVPPREFVARGSLSAAAGNVIAMDSLVAW